jgi:hypothetical protein
VGDERVCIVRVFGLSSAYILAFLLLIPCALGQQDRDTPSKVKKPSEQLQVKGKGSSTDDKKQADGQAKGAVASESRQNGTDKSARRVSGPAGPIPADPPSDPCINDPTLCKPTPQPDSPTKPKKEHGKSS